MICFALFLFYFCIPFVLVVARYPQFLHLFYRPICRFIVFVILDCSSSQLLFFCNICVVSFLSICASSLSLLLLRSLFFIFFYFFLKFVLCAAHHVSSVVRSCLLFSLILLVSKFQTTGITLSFCISFAETATTQFNSLNIVPISFFWSPRSKALKVISPSLGVLLLLCGDIQPNPGPTTNSSFRVCTLNIRSLLNPLKFTTISDFAESRHI